MVHLQLKIVFPLSTSLHTTGNRRRWGADKALAMTTDGRYVIPATTIKGFLRDRAEMLLRTWGCKVCDAPMPGAMCAGENDLCLACQIFGNPRYSSPLRFQDAALDDEVGTMIRSGVGISRSRRAAFPQHLFFIETTEARPTQAIAEIEGYFLDAEMAGQAAAMIDLAARSGYALGGGRTRGLGWLVRGRVEVEVSLDDRPLSSEVLEVHWQRWTGGQDVAKD